MENLIVSFQVIFPLFAMMALGFLLHKVKLFDTHTADTMNRITFRIFLPLLIFYNIYSTDLKSIFDGKLILLALGMVFFLFFLLWLVVPRLEKDHRRKGVLIQGMFRSNFVLFGLPVTASLFGEDQVGTAAMLVAFVVPLYNVLSVIVLEWYSEKQIHPKKILKGIATNPLILGAVCGFLLLLLDLRLPSPLEKTVVDLSRIATPLAFLVLGASFEFSAIRRNLRPLLSTVCVKLLLFPAILLPVAIRLGYTGVPLAALLAMLGAPTAVSSFTMAKQMNGDDELAGQIVVFTSICSVLTMFFWVFLFKELGLF